MQPSNTVAEPPAPVMDVRPPIEEQVPEEQPKPIPPDHELPAHASEPPQPPRQQKAPPVPKQPRSGVTAAIVATVIIVLGLAALATYAYLKTR